MRKIIIITIMLSMVSTSVMAAGERLFLAEPKEVSYTTMKVDTYELIAMSTKDWNQGSESYTVYIGRQIKKAVKKAGGNGAIINKMECKPYVYRVKTNVNKCYPNCDGTGYDMLTDKYKVEFTIIKLTK